MQNAREIGGTLKRVQSPSDVCSLSSDLQWIN